MIGIRTGLVVGLRDGFAVGLGADPIATDSTTALTVAINDSADPVGASANFNYTVVVTNVYPATLNNVSAVINLDASLIFVSGSGAGWTVNAVGRVVTCTLASLAVGAAPTITITVTAGASPLTASSTADATANDVPAAAQATQTTSIQIVSTTLTVALTDSADPVMISTNYNYLTVVTNTGAVAATSVSSVINLDASLTFVSGSGTGWTVGVFGQVVTCTRATLAVGAAPTITITVTAGAAPRTASSTADASASNAAAATQSVQTTQIALIGVTRDATSGIYCPANTSEWSIAMSAAGIASGGPSLLWLCQEASGNLVDNIGGFAGVASGTPITYQQPVTGWSRLGITGSPSGTGTGDFRSVAAGLPDLAITSVLWLGYETIVSVPIDRQLFYSQNQLLQALAIGPRLQAYSTSAGVSGAANLTGAVRPFGFLYDVTNNRVAGWSDQEILMPVRVATSGKRFQLNIGFNGSMLYQVGFFGAAAELANAQIKALLIALGWSIAW